jgi:hypothetical protein
MGLITIYNGPNPNSGELNLVHEGQGNVWFSLSKDWIPEEQLPEAALTDVVVYLKERKDNLKFGNITKPELTHTNDSKDPHATDLGFQTWYKLRYFIDLILDQQVAYGDFVNKLDDLEGKEKIGEILAPLPQGYFVWLNMLLIGAISELNQICNSYFLDIKPQ